LVQAIAQSSVLTADGRRPTNAVSSRWSAVETQITMMVACTKHDSSTSRTKLRGFHLFSHERLANTTKKRVQYIAPTVALLVRDEKLGFAEKSVSVPAIRTELRIT
jgi:hypothetical protein